MIVLRATELGMCFGVRDALAAMTRLPAPRDVTVHGELVHNPEVLRDLERRGFRASDEVTRGVPATPAVLITAHGISARERARLGAAGKQLIDTTCPLVEKAHAAAHTLAAAGRRLVVLGKHGHVEVRGLVEDHRDAVVIETEADVRALGSAPLGVVCQTTLPTATAARLLAALRAANPDADVAFVDTVCAPTRARQQALQDLLPNVEALVVVGGRGSNNTQRLAATARAAGVPVTQVEAAAELDPDWVRRYRCIGLTAGTSTLDATVDAVEARLRAIGAGPSSRTGRSGHNRSSSQAASQPQAPASSPRPTTST
ncbi:MAG: 4-hydroxy-3-methylbut-2-enyl diphosphate reductase [Planctomycetota bacterium]